MSDLLQKFLSRGPVLTDGAWGTELQSRGLPVGEFPDLWNLTHPEHVGAVARSYVEAGSQLILTNTFGSNRFRINTEGSGVDVAALNSKGVEISREAAGRSAFVFGSVGPSGKLLAAGEVTADELLQAFVEQTTALAQAGADGLVLETFSDLEELLVALDAARQTALPIVACLVYDSGKNKDRTMMGTTPEQAAAALEKAGAAAIGANCGQGIAGFVSICQRLKAATRLPVWIKANAGLPELVAGRATYRTTPEEFASYTPALVEAGASFLGGCCGTSPAFISAMKNRLHSAVSK